MFFISTGCGSCTLKCLNFEVHKNHKDHETQGLSKKLLVVRRGKPFKLTLIFENVWNPDSVSLVLEVCLEGLPQRVPVLSCDQLSDPLSGPWSAKIYPGDILSRSVTIYMCSPVTAPVAQYDLTVLTETRQNRSSYKVKPFVLLFNPWLKADPVYMQLDVDKEEYIKNDHGVVYMGTNLNVITRPWSFGQYEAGVLEACLKLLQVSPHHLSNKYKDYRRRRDPVYVSRVLCAMVNCNDDLGIIKGKWQGSWKDGVRPTDWSGSAEILHSWVSSNCSPVSYGQCWVFASVLCTVMRVLGIPSRVVTIYNAAHDTDATLEIEEFYTSKGEKLNMSNDSIWNFHVWVECWMRRPDLGAEFDGWQVVDPTPQERSNGMFVCGPCPVAAIQQKRFDVQYDAAFIYASVDAEVIRVIVHDRLQVERMVDTESVGKLIYTKKVGSDNPENLTQKTSSMFIRRYMVCQETVPHTVSLKIDGMVSVGESIHVSVTITNHSSSPRILMEHVNAQMKEYNKGPKQCFWKTSRKVHMQPHQVLTLQDQISPSEYESALAGDNTVNLAVVIKDVWTEERVLATQEFNISSPQIIIEIEGENRIQMNRKHKAHVSFINIFTKALSPVLLTVTGSGLLEEKQEASMLHLMPGKKIKKNLYIMASSPGTKLLVATVLHSHYYIVAKSFYKVSVIPA
uniref:Transglutaminase-like domain-containing protein n=1 Tax=Anabas testudineus TaxID=64144 RepID=A0A3Q1HB60_ANATE